MIYTSDDPEHEFLWHSNAIEGVHDLISHIHAVSAWNYLKSQKKLSLHAIRTTHALLMKEQETLKESEKGRFRTIPIYVGTKEMLKPLFIEESLVEWIKAMNAKQAHPELNWKQLHVDYERIHPFVDGNGRTGRMFMNWGRLRNNLPLLTIHEGEEQMEYYKWFH